MPSLRGLLFDLDGTLVDSAPDLIAATNDLLRELGHEPAASASLRAYAGSGARGMLGQTLRVHPGDDRYEVLKQRLHAHYEARSGVGTRCFDQVPELLRVARAAGLRLGIVTNKLRRFAQTNAMELALMPPAEVLVAGDCTPHTKPHPAPLLQAARLLGLQPADCAYIGDDWRDMQAAAAAGMVGWAAAWGYLGVERPVSQWGAAQIWQSPLELLEALPRMDVAGSAPQSATR